MRFDIGKCQQSGSIEVDWTYTNWITEKLKKYFAIDTRHLQYLANWHSAGKCKIAQK